MSGKRQKAVVPGILRELGVTYRQLDYWFRQGYLGPDWRYQHTSGIPRLWTEDKLKTARTLAKASRVKNLPLPQFASWMKSNGLLPGEDKKEASA